MNPCPECGAPHYPGTLFCDTCGAAVHPAAQAHVAAARAARPSALRPAPARIAGVPPASSPTAQSHRPGGEPIAGDSPVPSPGEQSHRDGGDPIDAPALRVSIPHHNAELVVRGVYIQVGRADPDGSAAPELDLTPFGGQERGVSRRHATIQWVEGGYVIIDQHSTNGTWLDGVRLVAGYAYQIPPGANVRMGGLLVQLSIAD